MMVLLLRTRPQAHQNKNMNSYQLVQGWISVLQIMEGFSNLEEGVEWLKNCSSYISISIETAEMMDQPYWLLKIKRVTSMGAMLLNLGRGTETFTVT